MKFSLQLGKLNFQLGTRNSELGTVTRSAGPIQSWLRGEDLNATGAALVSPFQQSVWVYTVVSALAQTVSAIPFRISRGDRSGENLLSDGPVVDLFNRPHESLNRFRFWEFIVTWYCLRGEVFIVALDKHGAILPIGRRAAYPRPSDGRGIKGEGSQIRNPQSAVRNPQSALGCRSGSPEIRNPQSAIRNLLVLPPDQFRHIVSGYELAGWQFHSAPLSGPLPAQSLTPDEVLHDFLPNPYLFWRGMSPLSVAMLAAQTDYASAQFMKGLMLNNADTGVIVRTDQQLTAEQREQMKAALDERKRSAGTADRPLLLWGGAEIVKPTLSSADLQFLEHRKFNRQEICAAFFRMPQSLVGFTEDANRAIHQSERLNFIENSISPFCARLEAAVEPIVKSFGQDLVGWFDLDSLPILQQARRDRVDTGTKLFALGYPANAINKTLDLGLPHIGWGDTGYLPATLQKAGNGNEQAPSPDPNQQAASPIERMQQTLRKLAAASKSGPQTLRVCSPSDTPEAPPHNLQPSTSNLQPGHARSGSSAFEASLRPRIKQKLSKLCAFFFNQRNRVLANLDRLAKADSDYATDPRPTEPRASASGHGTVNSEPETRNSELKMRSQTTTRSVAAIFDPIEETKLLLKKLSPLLRADLELGFSMIADKIGMEAKQVGSEEAGSFLAQKEKKLKAVNETTFKELDASLLEGLRNSEPLAQLVERVKTIFDDARVRRAPTIAESETTAAVNAGRTLGMQAGNVEKKGWQTADDEKVRDAHAAAESAYAKGIPIDEPFIVGGEALMYPGDDAGSIGNVINCRCYTFPITGDQ